MRFSPRSLTISILLAIALLGAWLRFSDLAGPSLWLDEILNVEIIRGLDRLPLHAWLFGFERENGPVYFALHAISLALFEPVEFGMRLPSAVAGAISLIVIFSVARRLTGSAITGLVAALLLAVSPFHVYYSREGRPYAILVLLTLLAIGALLDARGPRNVALAIVLLTAAATAAISVPLLVTVCAVTLFMGWRSPSHVTRQAWFLSAAIALDSVVAAILLYSRFDQPNPAARFAGSLERTGAMILNGFATTAGQNGVVEPIAIAAFSAAVFGFVCIRDRGHAFIIGATIVISIGVTLEVLALRDHWFSLRYVIHGLAPFLILVATGIVATATAVTSRVFRGVPRLYTAISGVLTIALLAPLVVLPFGAARREPLERADWRRIASVLATHAHANDLVVASSAWSEVCLSFYLRELGRFLDVRNIEESLRFARDLVERRERAWIVTSGAEPGTIRSWACRYFLAARDEQEEARLYYAPGLFDFMAQRATEQERSRFTRAFDELPVGRIGMERWDDALRTGWYAPEHAGDTTFRWARQVASASVPIPSGKAVLRFRASPVGEGQSVTVTADGTAFPTITMTPGPSEYKLALGSIDEPRVAEVSFRFSYEASPQSMVGSDDTRPLSAAFEWIEVDAGAGSHVAERILFHVAGYRDRVVDTTNCPRGASLSPDARRLFLMRLGYDADDSGEGAIPPEMLVDAFAPRECLPDSAFVDTLYVTLLGRRADGVGRTFYTGSLSAGWPRSRIACMMMESDELTRLYEGRAGERGRD